jgi:hypothetical protein
MGGKSGYATVQTAFHPSDSKTSLMWMYLLFVMHVVDSSVFFFFFHAKRQDMELH